MAFPKPPNCQLLQIDSTNLRFTGGKFQKYAPGTRISQEEVSSNALSQPTGYILDIYVYMRIYKSDWGTQILMTLLHTRGLVGHIRPSGR